MQLDDYLNSQSIRSLQLLQWYWGAGTDRSSSKSELLRLLRRAMLDPERALQAYEDLSPEGRSLLRTLLRQPGYSGYAARLASRDFWLNRAAPAGEEPAEELQRRGFAACLPPREGERSNTLRCVVPRELGRVLAEALNLDVRDPATMLSLRRRRAEGPLPAPPEPGAIESRIAELADPTLQRAARAALHDHAGVVSSSDSVAALDVSWADIDRSAWRAALEAAGLGTFGHLRLLDYGLGDDRDCLVLYQELVEAHAAACGTEAPELDQVHACGINFLLDLATLVDFLRAGPFRLTARDRPLKGARNLLLPLMALKTAHRLDEVELLAHKIDVASRLGLVKMGDDERLRATDKAVDWENLPLPDQASSVLLLHLRHSRMSWDPIRLELLANTARQAILSSPPGVWFPANAFLGRVVARHILGLLERGPRPGLASGGSVPTHSQLLAVARDRLLGAFHHIGALDIGRRGRGVFVAASPLAPVVLGSAPLPQPAHPLLLVNPDFEVILFPEEGHLELLRQLSAFAQRAKSEVTIHLRITQGSIQRAILRGLGAEEIIGTLRAHGRAPLPQNVEYSIRNWAEGVHPATLNTLHVLEVDSAEALDAALGIPAFASQVLRRLSPTAVVLSSPQLGPVADDELRRLGIHVAVAPRS